MKKKLMVSLATLSLGLSASPALASGDGMADLATYSGWYMFIAQLFTVF